MLLLAERYRVSPGKDWWEDATRVEVLAGLAAWVARYDSGEWDDAPGKLALLYDIERVRGLVSGPEPFDPRRDRGGVLPVPDRHRLPAAARRQLGSRGPT